MELNNFQLTSLIEINNKYIIKYNDIKLLNEEYNLSYNYIIKELSEINNVNKNNIIIAINETDIIIDSTIINEFNNNNIAIIPLSKNDVIYQLCEDCVDAYIETGSIEYMDLLLDESVFINKIFGENQQSKYAKTARYVTKGGKNNIRHEHTPRINILTGNINYLHEENKKPVQLTYDLRDFAGPDAEEKMKLRLIHAYKSTYDKSAKIIAKKIAALRDLGNRLKQREEKTIDIVAKEKLQNAFDKVKNTARSLINKITPSFLK